MAVKSLYVATAILVGLLAVLLIDLALGASGALAQERKNCPAGFVWIRWSPNGCSQEVLPAHGYINADGYGVCETGYDADYEERPTTDGKPPPGSGRTSFPYLKACLSSTTGAAGAGGFSGTAGDAAEQLYDGGGGPSGEELATVGVGFGAGFGLATWRTLGIGAGVGGPPGAIRVGATRAPSLDQMIAESKKRLEVLKRQRMEALNDHKAAINLLGFYSWHYWTGSIPRWMAVGGISALAALTIEKLTAFARIVVGGTLYTFTIQNTSWPPPQDEAAKMIPKFRAMMLRTGNRVAAIDAQIKGEEQRLLQMEAKKLFSTTP